MSENETIPIRIRRSTHKKLKELKVHPNQSYDEVIQKLLEKEAT